MNDKQLIDWMERDGIQAWPVRASKHGPVLRWWVQLVLPFMQVSDTTLRAALEKLAEARRRIAEDTPN